MAKKLTPKQVDKKVRKLNKQVTKLKALKEEIKKVDKLGRAISRISKKHPKKVIRKKKK